MTSTLNREPVVVRPSRLVRFVVRPMTKVFNPGIRRLAGRKHFPNAAQIRHRGRRSGRVYVTPASARRHEDALYVPLTFTRNSDWCRNVLASGGCVVKLRGVDYATTQPRVVDKAVALAMAGSAFRRMERFMFRPLGIKEFLVLQIAP